MAGGMLFASASTCVSRGSKGGTWILIGVYSSQQPQPIISEKLGNVWAFTSSNLTQVLSCFFFLVFFKNYFHLK